VVNGSLSLAVRRTLRVHGQARHVGANRSALFGFEHNRKLQPHHSTPASRRMRFPSLPASWPCIVTQTSLPVRGLMNRTYDPLPVRFSTKPAAFNFRMTSFQVTHCHNNLTIGYCQRGRTVVGSGTGVVIGSSLAVSRVSPWRR